MTGPTESSSSSCVGTFTKRIIVATYHGALPLRIHPGKSPEGLPTDLVAWVDVICDGFRQRLAGRDYFWVCGDAFGMFNAQENLAWYGGNPDEQSTAWRWTGVGSEIVNVDVPEYATVFEGVMLPNDEWEVARAY